MTARRTFMLLTVVGFLTGNVSMAMADSKSGSGKGSDNEREDSDREDSDREDRDREDNDREDNDREDNGGDDGDGSGGSANSGKGNSESDDGKIRAAVRSGKAEPLRDILAIVRKRYHGRVVRIRLTGSGSKLIYRIRIIDPQNNLIEVQVKASNGRILTPSGIY